MKIGILLMIIGLIILFLHKEYKQQTITNQEISPKEPKEINNDILLPIEESLDFKDSTSLIEYTEESLL